MDLKEWAKFQESLLYFTKCRCRARLDSLLIFSSFFQQLFFLHLILGNMYLLSSTPYWLCS